MAGLADRLFGSEINIYLATVEASEQGLSNAQLTGPPSYPDLKVWSAHQQPDGSWKVNTGGAVYLVFEDGRQPIQIQIPPGQ